MLPGANVAPLPSWILNSLGEIMNRKKLAGLVICVLIVLAAIGGIVATSSPGFQETVEQEDRLEPLPKPPETAIERLRLPWNSEDTSDWPAAEVLANLSQHAYLSPVEAETAFKTLGFSEVTTLADRSMIGYVLHSDGVCVIIFRGTDDGFDWFTNLGSLSTGTPHGSIHRGFLGSYQPLKRQIGIVLDQIDPEEIWITGHSLGGALALVCAYDLIATEQGEISGVMTFGQPMVAGSELANYLDEQLVGRYAHFVNDADIVPRVPPGYSHCGSLVWFTKEGIRRSKRNQPLFGDLPVGADKLEDEGAVLEPLSETEFERLKAQLRMENAEPERDAEGRILMKGNSPLLQDHSMGLYLEKIREIKGLSGTD